MDAQRLADLRRSYSTGGLAESDLAADPYTQFSLWLTEAVDAGLTEPNAMVLGTVGPDGRPSSRTVLLKGVDAAAADGAHGGRGFVFFTNYTSRKGRELDAHPGASLLFPWYDLERQVSVSGVVRRVAAAESAAYFRSRPYGSRIGAWTSHQSEVIDSRDGLEQRYAELLRRWPDGPPPGLPDAVPVPDFWGGFRLVPDAVEFWQGRPSRLHDRLRYVRTAPAGPGTGGWRVERLSP